ncbi:MAG: hypothetical protein U0166_08480 [Acidobacteriota bacterium]
MTRALLLVHLGAAVLLLGASGHAAIASVQIARGRADKQRLARTYATIVAVVYPIVLGLGALLYPSFGLGVRGPYFDVAAPWASRLFEIKEHVAALTLPLPIVSVAIHRGSPGAGRGARRAHVALAWIVFAAVLLSATTGALLVSIRSVGAASL